MQSLYIYTAASDNIFLRKGVAVSWCVLIFTITVVLPVGQQREPLRVGTA